MSDAYQAIYDAVRSRISNGDVGAAIQAVAERAFDISDYTTRLYQDFSIAAAERVRPSVVFRPSLSIDGDMWCALYGDDLQNGVAGFGQTPDEAMREFDKAWHQKLPRAKSAGDCINDLRRDLAEILKP